MSQTLTLRWVTRSHKTGTQLPGRAGDGSGKVCESVGRIILELQVPPLLTKARAQEYFLRAKHSSDVHPRTLGHRVPAGIPSALGVASSWEVVNFPPRFSLGLPRSHLPVRASFNHRASVWSTLCSW